LQAATEASLRDIYEGPTLASWRSSSTPAERRLAWTTSSLAPRRNGGGGTTLWRAAWNVFRQLASELETADERSFRGFVETVSCWVAVEHQKSLDEGGDDDTSCGIFN
jgi:hypothetical protein